MTLRLPYLGKYVRDRYAEPLSPEKQAMVDAHLQRASQEDLEKVGFGFGDIAGAFNKYIAQPFENVTGFDVVKSGPKAGPKPAGKSVPKGTTKSWREQMRAKTLARTSGATKPKGPGAKIKSVGKALTGAARPAEAQAKPPKPPGQR